jgi:molybdenum cofactor biosynthesis enzyme MoaA
MKITSLGLHITDHCNARCLHCAFGCGPEIEGSMEVEEAKRYVTDAGTLGAEIICITGGEPMISPSG